jgi:hypothetical protein
MAIDSAKLAGYITSEIVGAFKLGKSNESLDKYAAAMANAVSKYLSIDVEVGVGQQVQGQGTGTTEADLVPPTPGVIVTVDPIVTTVKGQIVTKGKLV